MEKGRRSIGGMRNTEHGTTGSRSASAWPLTQSHTTWLTDSLKKKKGIYDHDSRSLPQTSSMREYWDWESRVEGLAGLAVIGKRK